jgi:hypothetical protein
MSRIPFVLASIAVAALAGCASESRVTPAPAPVVVTPAPVVAAPAPSVVVQQPNGQAVVVPQANAGAAVVVPPAPGPLRAGFGRVASITPIPVAAAGGGTVMSANRRIGLRMDDGSMQYVDSTATPLAVGDRIEIMADGKMRYPVQ